MRSDGKGKKKKARPEGSPPSSYPQKKTLATIKNSVALAPFILDIASWEGAHVQLFKDIS